MKIFTRFVSVFAALTLCVGVLALPAAAADAITAANTDITCLDSSGNMSSNTISKGKGYKITLTFEDANLPSTVQKSDDISATLTQATLTKFSTSSSTVLAKNLNTTRAPGSPATYEVTFENVFYSGSAESEEFKFTLNYSSSNLPAKEYTQNLKIVATPTPAPSETPTPIGSGVYVQAVTVTDPAGGEVGTVKWNDRVNIVLRVVDHSSAKNNVSANEIVTRINSSVFTYTGIGEISQLVEGKDDAGDYYSYVLLFRDVIYNGGGNTLPIDLSYLDTSMQLQQFSVTIGQCVDKDPADASNAKTPSLVVRESSYGTDAVTAGTPFTLSLTVYATKGSEGLDDVIVSLTLPKGITLSGGSLSTYIGHINSKGTCSVSYPVLPASSFTDGVANITVNMTGIGAASSNAASGSSVISIPIAQPDRFELGDMECPETMTVGEQNSVTLNFVNKGKNPVANLEATLIGNNLGTDSQSQYIGNINAGTSNSVDFDITPSEVGSYSGTITLTYEDGNGAIKTVAQAFSGNVEEAMYVDDFNPMPVEEPAKGLPVPLMIGIVAAVAVAVGVILTLRRRSKAKALAQLEDVDDGFEDEAPALPQGDKAALTTAAPGPAEDKNDHEDL